MEPQTGMANNPFLVALHNAPGPENKGGDRDLQYLVN